jgi:membrane protein implicated in regulation of membrane protease activity
MTMDSFLESLGKALEGAGALLDMDGGYFWVLLGLVLIVLESFGAALALASLGVGAIVTGIVAFTGALGLYGLLVVFCLASLVLFAVSRPLANKITNKGGAQETNIMGLMGLTALVVHDIGGTHKPGYVKVRGEEWRAIPAGDIAIGTGSTVYVVGSQGATLVVDTNKPVEKEVE